MNYIERYKNVLDPSTCQKIIDYFEKSLDKHVGRYGNDSIVNQKYKKSTDLYFNIFDSNWVSTYLPPIIVSQVKKYIKKYSFLETGLCEMETTMSMKRYYPGEGYYKEHCENSSQGSDSCRMLAWMIYLNNVRGGGTYWPQQSFKSKAKQGSMYIWPAGWTHSHKGIVAKEDIKYIISGWFRFK